MTRETKITNAAFSKNGLMAKVKRASSKSSFHKIIHKLHKRLSIAMIVYNHEAIN